MAASASVTGSRMVALVFHGVPPVGIQHSRFEQLCLRAGQLPIRLGVVTRLSAGFQVDTLSVHSGLRMKSMVGKILLITYQLGVQGNLGIQCRNFRLYRVQLLCCEASKIACHLLEFAQASSTIVRCGLQSVKFAGEFRNFRGDIRR